MWFSWQYSPDENIFSFKYTDSKRFLLEIHIIMASDIFTTHILLNVSHINRHQFIPFRFMLITIVKWFPIPSGLIASCRRNFATDASVPFPFPFPFLFIWSPVGQIHNGIGVSAQSPYPSHTPGCLLFTSLFTLHPNPHPPGPDSALIHYRFRLIAPIFVTAGL